MNNVSEFNKFIGTISLSKAMRRKVDRRVRAVKGLLDRHPDSFSSIERRGSYALRTIIRPGKDDDYDVDLLVFMKDFGRGKRAPEYISQVHQWLREDSNYVDKVILKFRSVTVNYSEGFHLDLVPCIKRGNQDLICNYRTGEFEETDGTGFRDWFNGQSNITYGNLKPAVRLLKQIRQEKDNFEIPSVTLTALAGKMVSGRSDGVNFRNIPHALCTTSNRISQFLGDNSAVPELSNPAFSLEKLTRNWQQRDYNNFKEKFLIYNEQINSAYTENDRARSIQKWRGLFGDNFGR